MIPILALLYFFTSSAFSSDDAPLYQTGAVGGGVFVPLGEDGDIASAGPNLELSASIGMTRWYGFEADFVYTPIQLDASSLAGTFRKSSQIALLAGIRLVTASPMTASPSFVLSFRSGFVRIATRAEVEQAGQGWIGGSVTEVEAGPSATSPYRVTREAFAFSPRLGAMIPLPGRAFLDIGIAPLFVMYQGTVATQLHMGARFALSNVRGR